MTTHPTWRVEILCRCDFCAPHPSAWWTYELITAWEPTSAEDIRSSGLHVFHGNCNGRGGVIERIVSVERNAT